MLLPKLRYLSRKGVRLLYPQRCFLGYGIISCLVGNVSCAAIPRNSYLRVTYCKISFRLHVRTNVRQSQLIDKRAWCPHCLYAGTENDFIRRKVMPPSIIEIDSTSKFTRKETLKEQRKQRAMRQCTDCGHRFRATSMLTPDTTTEEYAKFVAAYPNFFRGLDFAKWSARLKAYGMSNDFWTAYKIEKARIHGYETYEQYKAASHQA